MYCKNCGREHPTDLSAVCTNCGTPKGVGNQFCPNCGIQTPPNANVCSRCGTQLNVPQMNYTPYNPPMPYGATQKSKLAAGLLGIFLGAFGVHNFYLGYTTKGLIQVLISIIGGIITCGIATVIVEIWGLIEGILIISGSTPYTVDGKGIPLRD